MDTTPEYIKMCEKATEIQEQHDMEYGDCYIHKGTGALLIIVPKYSTEFQAINITAKCNFNDLIPSHITWLPRQDQLQEILLKKYDVDSLEMAFHSFINDARFLLNKTTFEQLWLMFFMKERHNKVWNGEDWVKA